jgi:hypothetical protein
MCCFVGDGLLLPLKKWDWFWALKYIQVHACLFVFLKTKKKEGKHVRESILQSKREQT